MCWMLCVCCSKSRPRGRNSCARVGGGASKGHLLHRLPRQKASLHKNETKDHLLEMLCEKVLHVHSCSKEKAAQNGVVELKSRNTFPISEACE